MFWRKKKKTNQIIFQHGGKGLFVNRYDETNVPIRIKHIILLVLTSFLVIFFLFFIKDILRLKAQYQVLNKIKQSIEKNSIPSCIKINEDLNSFNQNCKSKLEINKVIRKGNIAIYSGQYDLIFLDQKLHKVQILITSVDEDKIDPTPDKNKLYPKWLVNMVFDKSLEFQNYKVNTHFDQNNHLKRIEIVSRIDRNFFNKNTVKDQSIPFHKEELANVKESALKGNFPLQSCVKSMEVHIDQFFDNCGSKYNLLVMNSLGDIRIEYLFKERKVEYIFINHHLVFIRTRENRPIELDNTSLQLITSNPITGPYGIEFQKGNLRFAVDVQGDFLYGFTLYTISRTDLEMLKEELADNLNYEEVEQ